MTEQNQGGGCLLFLIDWIVGIFQNRKIQQYNQQSRGLAEYSSISTDTLFPNESYQESIIVSGGDTSVRLRFNDQIINNCHNNGQVMIILHLTNNGLENIITTNNLGVVVNKNNKLFDAFTYFNLQEITQIVLDTCKSKYDIKPSGRYILQIVHELLLSQNIRPYFSNYANISYHQLSNLINDCLIQGFINQSKANDLNALLMMGQSECSKIDSFFYDAKAQMKHIATDNANNTGGVSILSAIKKEKILCIDLNSSANTMLIELIVNSIVIAMNRGYDFSFFLDDVAIANNEMLKNALCHKSKHNNIICSQDLYALLGGKDDVFSTIVGVTDKTVLLTHGSHLSCEKWSKYFGEYDKKDVESNSTGGWGQSNRWWYTSNYGKRVANKREYKIKPEQINRLKQNEVFVYDNQSGNLIQTKVV